MSWAAGIGDELQAEPGADARREDGGAVCQAADLIGLLHHRRFERDPIHPVVLPAGEINRDS